MPRTGRKPKPTALKLLKGDLRSVNHHEPPPAPGTLEPPGDLTPDERAAWDDIVAALPGGGVATRSDAIGLRVFAYEFALFLQSAELVATVGPLVRDEKGQPRANPAVRIAREAARSVLRCCAEFGMTPSARSLLFANPRHDPGAAEIAARYLTRPT